MALLPNNTFERNQFAAGRQAIEQRQQLANASRANTPAQAAVAARGIGPAPTPQFLVDGITSETSQMPANMGNGGSPGLLDAARAVGQGLGIGEVPNVSPNSPLAGVPLGNGGGVQAIGQDLQAAWDYLNFVPQAQAATPQAPPSTIAAPPPASLRAPAAAPDVPAYQAPSAGELAAQGIGNFSQPTLETTPMPPAAPDVVGSPGYTGSYVPPTTANAAPSTSSTPVAAAGTATPGPMTSTPGVYTDQTAPQMAAGSTSAGNGTLSFTGGGGFGVGAGGPGLQQPGGRLVDEFLAARDQYLGMDSGNSSLAERGRALNALRALAPQATTEQQAQASMYGDDQSLARGLGVADIGRDATLGATALTQTGGLDRAVLQADTQARGQDLQYGVGMANAENQRLQAEAAGRVDPLTQLLQQVAVQQAQQGQLGLNEIASLAFGEVPQQTFINDGLGNPIGVQTPNGPQPLSPQQVAFLAQMQSLTDEQLQGMNSYYTNTGQ